MKLGNDKQSRPLWFGWAIFGGAIIVTVTALTLAWPALVSALEGTPIWPKPTPYSEVFFADQAKSTNSANSVITFNLGNFESDTTNYRYQTKVACAGEATRQVASGATTLDVGARETLSFLLAEQSCATTPLLNIEVKYMQPGSNESRALRLTRHLD